MEKLDKELIEAGVLNEAALAAMRGMLAILRIEAQYGDEVIDLLPRLALFGSRAVIRVYLLSQDAETLSGILLANI